MRFFTGNIEVDTKKFCDFYYESVVCNYNLMEHGDNPEDIFLSNMSVLVFLMFMRDRNWDLKDKDTMPAIKEYLKCEELPEDHDELMRHLCANIRGAEIRTDCTLVTESIVSKILIMTLDALVNSAFPAMMQMIRARSSK